MKNEILENLLEEKKMRLKGRLYHYTQIKFAYNTNRIEGSMLTEEQTRYIYETNTISTEENNSVKVDDIIETVNHFCCFNYLLDIVNEPLSEEIIKKFHEILKRGTTDSLKDWFKAGDYKTRENFIGDIATTLPKDVRKMMKKLLSNYNIKNTNLNEIIDFHYNFEIIHPFQDGNGRVGRLIMFKECLKNNIVPFIIEDKDKQYYYKGLKEYSQSKIRLIDTCLYSQDIYKDILKYLKIKFNKKENKKKNDVRKRTK